jgi:hypothetical protein
MIVLHKIYHFSFFYRIIISPVLAENIQNWHRAQSTIAGETCIGAELWLGQLTLAWTAEHCFGAEPWLGWLNPGLDG